MFEELLKLSPDSVVLADTEGRIVDVSPQAEELFGYQRSELIGQRIEILIPERFQKDHPSYRNGYSKNPRLRPMGAGLQLVARNKDGSEIPVDIMLRPVDGPSGKIIVTVIRDVREQKRAQEALRQSEQLFRSIVEGVRDYAIFTLDRNGKVATWNAGAEQIKGYKAEEIVGQHFSRFYTQEDIDRQKPEEELQIAAEKGRVEDEGWRIRKDGSRFWANVLITAIHDANGKLIGFSKIARDFTDRKRAEEALLLQLSGVLLSNVDVRKLLSAISTSIQNVVPHDVGILGLYDPVTDHFRVQLLDTSNPLRTIETAVPVKDSPAGWAFTRREPLMLGDITAADFAPETYAHLFSMGVKSACWLPLLNRDRAIGTLTIASRRVSAFEKHDVEMLSKIAGQIAAAVDNALAFRQISELKDRLQEEKQYLQEELNTEHGFEDIIGESTGLKRVLKEVETVAPTEATVLIEGETGTGKELIARAVHRLSNRNERPFIKLNCAAIPSGLLESELFGHEKGAFTGAIAQKIGRLELADGGTLFLDEVGELPLELQPKLLRALQEKEIERLGGTRTIPVDVRLVAATNRNLRQMVADKQFRSDLFYRLHVFPVTVPALRQRRDDIPLLVRYFVDKHSRKLGKNIETIPQDVMGALSHWSWPGNIRELENFIERAVILSKGTVLRAPLAELQMAEESGEKAFAAAVDSTLEAAERDLILRVLRETKEIGGPNGAAAKLGLKRTTLNSKLKKLGISRTDYV
jgi:formate hydrogenlyase transcriptional activator